MMMMISFGHQALLFLSLLSSAVATNQQVFKDASEFPSSVTEIGNGNYEVNGARWAILVSGSRTYENYRHQADVCHAYQILKKGGLRDENIVVFMYDDIAFSLENPRPGILINKPDGNDVYFGVPKDYTGENCTAKNFFAALLGNKSALTGGSGKVVNSGPNDYIFIYYTDHGSPGVIGMPSGDDLYAKDLIEVLQRKHATNSYKSMVFYLEACESGSMFEGLLPKNLSIYAITAANASESSYAFYCPGDLPSPPEEYYACLGDLFSVAWMEDSDLHDSRKETLARQYEVVRRRTADDNLDDSSHVMKYGNLSLGKDLLFVYMGFNPENDNYTFPLRTTETPTIPKAVNQRDANLLYLRHKVLRTPERSQQKNEALRKLRDAIAHRRHVDRTMNKIVKAVLGEKLGLETMTLVRPSGLPLVDDWDCLKNMVRIYEMHCGELTWYGKKYTRAMANMCNAGATVEQMAVAAAQACPTLTPPPKA